MTGSCNEICCVVDDLLCCVGDVWKRRIIVMPRCCVFPVMWYNFVMWYNLEMDVYEV